MQETQTLRKKLPHIRQTKRARNSPFKKLWNEPRQIAKIEEEIGEQVMEDKEECTATVSTQDF